MRFQGHVVDAEAAEAAALQTTSALAGARVLEVGCGDGRLTRQYAPLARSVLAIDPSDAAIAKARKELPAQLADHVRYEIGSALELGHPPDSFDTVVFTHSL